MAKKATVQGFEEGGKFHPIRDSKGYSDKKATAAEKRKKRDENARKRKRH